MATDTTLPAGSTSTSIDDPKPNAAVPEKKKAGKADAAPTEGAAQIIGKNHDATLSGKLAEVTFFEQDTDIGKLPIQAGINGYSYQIPRGKPVKIPVELYEQLTKGCVEEVFEAHGATVVRKERPRFSCHLHGIS